MITYQTQVVRILYLLAAQAPMQQRVISLKRNREVLQKLHHCNLTLKWNGYLEPETAGLCLSEYARMLEVQLACRNLGRNQRLKRERNIQRTRELMDELGLTQ